MCECVVDALLECTLYGVLYEKEREREREREREKREAYINSHHSINLIIFRNNFFCQNPVQ